MLDLQALISFVVVTHDRPVEQVENGIVRSIAKQDHARCELVIVGEECPHLEDLVARTQHRFADLPLRWANVPRPKSKMLHPWGQAGLCRNRGIDLARGDFISCQDDDNELEHDFASSMLDRLLSTGAEAVWCYRRLVMPDGSPFPGTFFPWAAPGIAERLIFEMWCKAGILTPGSDIVKDQLLAVQNSETFSTVDANEWLGTAKLYREFPFRERFGFHELMANNSFDDTWNRDIRLAGVRVACSERPSLIYRLGGTSNGEFIARWLAQSRQGMPGERTKNIIHEE